MSQQSNSDAGDNRKEGHEVGDPRPKRARRSRKDCDQRSFICKICGKSYLSNAALYTHVKNKHEIDPKQKQEKPPAPVVQNQQSQQENGSEQGLSSKQNKQSNSIGVSQNALEGLRQYMKKYYPERNKGCTIRLICQGLAPQILQYMEPILKQGNQLRLIQVNRSKLTVNQVFGIFLSLMNLRVSSTCINFLIRFFYYLHCALKQQTKKSDYCERQNAYNIPNYFNNIILNNRIPAYGFDEDEIMHNPIIICKVAEHFSNWLYDERYTDFKVIANYKQQL